MINSGFIVAPRKRFLNLCFFIKNNIPENYGIDQLLANLFIYKEGFIDLGSNFNFILLTSLKKFKIKTLV